MKIKRILPIIVLYIIILFLSAVKKNVPTFDKSEEISLPVIMYHSVVDDPSRTGKYIITPQKFEEDIIYLKNKGYTSVTAKQLIKYVNLCEPLPEKPILITFDDGMYNNLYFALPILEKYDFSAVFSVVGSYTDEYTESGIKNAAYSYLTWNDISNLCNNPHIEFGNHSYNLHNISPKRFGAEKNKTESTLDYINVFYQDTEKLQSEFISNCNLKPIIYTYPFGSFSNESFRVIKKLGFMMSLSCTEGINKITHSPDCLYMLKRYNRDGNFNSESFFARIKI